MKIKTYIMNNLIAVDQLANAMTGGLPDHTISGRVGYHAALGKYWALKAEQVINSIFFWQEDHCRDSTEWCIVRRKVREERRNKRR